jgi:hypothetical protein
MGFVHTHPPATPANSSSSNSRQAVSGAFGNTRYRVSFVCSTTLIFTFGGNGPASGNAFKSSRLKTPLGSASNSVRNAASLAERRRICFSRSLIVSFSSAINFLVKLRGTKTPNVLHYSFSCQETLDRNLSNRMHSIRPKTGASFRQLGGVRIECAGKRASNRRFGNVADSAIRTAVLHDYRPPVSMPFVEIPATKPHTRGINAEPFRPFPLSGDDRI